MAHIKFSKNHEIIRRLLFLIDLVITTDNYSDTRDYYTHNIYRLSQIVLL